MFNMAENFQSVKDYIHSPRIRFPNSLLTRRGLSWYNLQEFR